MLARRAGEARRRPGWQATFHPATLPIELTDCDMNNPRQIYKVIFLNQGQIYEIYATQIYQSDLYGFIEVEEFLFGERAQMVVDAVRDAQQAQPSAADTAAAAFDAAQRQRGRLLSFLKK